MFEIVVDKEENIISIIDATSDIPTSLKEVFTLLKSRLPDILFCGDLVFGNIIHVVGDEDVEPISYFEISIKIDKFDNVDNYQSLLNCLAKVINLLNDFQVEFKIEDGTLTQAVIDFLKGDDRKNESS